MSEVEITNSYRLISERNPYGLVVTDQDGFFLYSNSAFQKLSSIASKNLIGKVFGEEITANISGHNQTLFQATQNSQVWEGEVKFPGKDTSFFVEMVEIKDSENSTQKRMFIFRELDLQVGIERKIKLQRLESLGTLAGGIAHDLSNILTGVLGHVSYLRLILGETGVQQESLKAIEQASRRGAEMTRQILNFARGENTEFGPVSLKEIIESAFTLLKSTIPVNINLSLDLETKGLVNGEESQLSQLIMNLIINARDALKEGGAIAVSLGNKTFAEYQMRVGNQELPAGKYVCLQIRDNGVGIAEDIKERIFEPFFTTKKDQGTGLGLSTVFSIVQLHSGFIEVESVENQGTGFNIYFPSLARSTKKQEAKNDLSLPTGSERILVVDDEEAVRTVIQRSLEHLGYMVDVAVDGTAALSTFTDNQDYSLVILDMMMPKMSGDQVYEKLKKINPKVQVLIASGYSSDNRAQAVLDTGGKGFIQKPFAIEELAKEVRRCLDSE